MSNALSAAIDYVNEHHPLPRCVHGSALEDGGGEKLQPPCGCGGEHTSEFINAHVPIELFGKDHWSTLAYIETRIVDHREFRIKGDPCMRTCKRCWRIAQSASAKEKQFDRVKIDGGNSYPTRLRDGRLADRHCDWDCLQDLVAAGILATRGEPGIGKKVTITTRGFIITGALRAHKASGGNFAGFVVPKEFAS